MQILRYGVAFGLIAGLGACSNMMGGSSSAPQSTAMAQPTVAPDLVRQVQSKLRDGGYYKTGPVDGIWGSDTQTSVRSFQHDHNLAGNGQLDLPTLQALNLTGNAAPGVANNNPPPATTTTPASQH